MSNSERDYDSKAIMDKLISEKDIELEQEMIARLDNNIDLLVSDRDKHAKAVAATWKWISTMPWPVFRDLAYEIHLMRRDKAWDAIREKLKHLPDIDVAMDVIAVCLYEAQSR